MPFIPNEASDLNDDDLEYDFMEDSVDEVVSSSESQTSQRSSKLSKLLGSLRGKPI